MRSIVWPWRMPPVVALLVLAGCSDPSTPYPVSGVVVFENGQPAKELAGGSVSFTPAVDERRGSSIGTIDEDGTFTLSCKREGDGAVAGKHRVVISLPEPDEAEGDNPRARRRPLKGILDPESAVQEVTVEPKRNSLTLQVKKPGRRAATGN